MQYCKSDQQEATPDPESTKKQTSFAHETSLRVHVSIDSELGKGTTLKIKLRLTLAIIPCQIVVTGGERYAILR